VATVTTLQALLSSFAADDAKLREEALGEFGVLQPAPVAALERADVKLGQALFWDARLSADGRIACASCHLPEDWGADRRRFSPDAKGKHTARNSQSVFNSTLQPSLRWTGDRQSAAHQAEKSLSGSMGFASAETVVPLLESLGYEPAFQAAYPQEPAPLSATNYANAIQAYEETLVTPAPFDRFLSGENDALTAEQKAGLRVFLDTGCADCHSGTLVGGRGLRKFGVSKDYWLATRSERQDAGLFETTKLEADRGRFRVSLLRNIARTGPYFHDGSVASLREAVQVMADVQLGSRLPEADAGSIVSFLDSLTGPIPANFKATSATP
jgi:cytochrome c peroxidase